MSPCPGGTNYTTARKYCDSTQPRFSLMAVWLLERFPKNDKM